MKYFVEVKDMVNTVYHEFQKGHFDGVTFWKEDSICLHDDIVCALGLEELFASVIPQYCSTEEIEVNEEQWNEMVQKAAHIGGEVKECITEADAWVKNTFAEHGVFTIIGV